MFLVKNTEGKILETLPRENFNEDYREAYSYAFHKYGQDFIFEEATI